MRFLSPLWIFVIFVCILLLALLITIPLAVWAVLSFGTTEDVLKFLTEPIVLLVLLLIQDSILVAVPYMVYIKTRLLSWADLGLEGEGVWTRALQGTVVGLGLAGLVMVIVVAIGYNTSGGVPVMENMTVSDYVLLLLGGSVIAPIAEEFFFRGIAFRGLMKYYEHKGSSAGFPVALMFSTVLFALAHGYDIIGTAVVFAAGLVFALLFHRTNSLMTPLFAHGAYNAGVITATFLGVI